MLFQPLEFLAVLKARIIKPRKSFALIDQLRSIDKRRIRRVFGELAREEITAIDEGLAVFLGLATGPNEDSETDANTDR